MASDLGEVGKKVLEALKRPTDSYEITLLITELARVGDRLARLDAIIAGDAAFWARIEVGRDGVSEIRIDGALQEARQQAGTYRQLLAELRRQRSDSADGPDDEGDDLAGL